jgi:hypothetical protein
MRLFVLVASKDGKIYGCKIIGETGKEKIFWETQAYMAG